MRNNLITWIVIFALSFVVGDVFSIEQGTAFFYTYIVVSLVCAIINTLVIKLKNDCVPGMTLTVLFMFMLTYTIGFSFAAIVACGIAALLPVVDFYIMFQIMCLVLCFVPNMKVSVTYNTKI